jgi:peptidoglycan hydrolase-like protein with peptidoglycan-binding domain
MQPTQTQNKFYKTVVNGQTYYEALPDLGNVPFGYTPISYNEFQSGLNSEISRYQNLASQNPGNPDYAKTAHGYQSLLSKYVGTESSATGAGQSGYITNPTTGKPQMLSQYVGDQANQAAIASGQMVQIGTAANGQPLYAPKGSYAATPGTQATAQNPNPTAGGGTGFLGAPKINIPNTIPDAALNYTGSKQSVIAKAQAMAPKANLQLGQSGPEVKQLQEFLISQGYQIPAGATGNFGEQTKAALTKFQQDQKVQAGQYYGYYGPKTREAADALLSGVKDATSKATDTASGIQAGNDVLKQSGLPELKISGTIDTADVPTVFSYFIESMQKKQGMLDEAQKALDAAISAGNRGAIKTEGQLGVTQTLIGRELQKLKETVAYTTQPIQDQVDSLTRAVGMDKDMMNTIMAYGQYVKNLNQPEYHTVGKTLLRMYPDGRVEQVYSAPETDGGGILSGLSAGIQSRLLQIAGAVDSSEITKRFNSAVEGLNIINGIDPMSLNPADHQAIVYAFAKGLDPDSAVKEGEYETIKKYAQSSIDKYGKEISNAINGTGFLSPAAIQNIQKTMNGALSSRRVAYDNLRKEKGRIIDNIAGIPVSNEILTDYGGGLIPQTEKTPETPEEIFKSVVTQEPEKPGFFKSLWGALGF